MVAHKSLVYKPQAAVIEKAFGKILCSVRNIIGLVGKHDMTKGNDNSEMRTRILRRRYLWKDAQGKVIETEEQMLRRVANAIATAESKYGVTKKQVKEFAEKFYKLMKNREFLPNSPTLMNAGRKYGMLSACFTLPVEDSIDAIFDAVKYAALIQKAGGGTGFSFDRLRPTGDIVASSPYTSVTS